MIQKFTKIMGFRLHKVENKVSSKEILVFGGDKKVQDKIQNLEVYTYR